MLSAGDIAGVTITPLLTVGDVLPNGYRFEAIPDGISVRTDNGKRKGDDGGKDKKKHDGGAVDIFVNHETSKVPFPYVTANPTAANGENDFDNAQVSLLTLDSSSGAVLDGSFAISSAEGFQRFCSNYLATRKEGLTVTSSLRTRSPPDYVFRQEASWPPPLDDPNQREVGVVVALDVKEGEHHPIYGMGRLNHENALAIPGYRDLVVFTGDDTFTSGPSTIPPGGPLTAASVPSQSQLYSYMARNVNKLLDDKGDLWAFVSDTPGVKNYYDVLPNSGTVVTGHFIKVPKTIATGLKPDGSEVKAADFRLSIAADERQLATRSSCPECSRRLRHWY